jgi:O-acetyl-ADP-ribose deacetylase (regulator of RNase III)
MIWYIQGDATDPQMEGYQIIAHICNDQGGFGKGFAAAIAQKYPIAQQKYYAMKPQGYTLGTTQLVEVNDQLAIANMIAQHGYKSRNNPVALRYRALDACLSGLARVALHYNASIHMPKIGTGLAGGDWARIWEYINFHLPNQHVYVYTLDSTGIPS